MAIGAMLPTCEDTDDQFEPDAEHRKDVKKQQADNQSPPNIVYLMTILSAMGGFLFGYDTGIVSGAMVFVRRVFRLNSVWQEVVVSITILGAWIFSLMSGSLSERYGRKRIILWASVIFTLGSIVMGFAWSKYILLFGRLTVGVAIGLASTVVPMYIAEVAPANIRGSLVTLNNCFITFGQLSAAVTAGAFSYDHKNGWRWMLALAAVPAVVQFVGFLFMPESPRWLIRNSRDQEALTALKRIRGQKCPNYIVMREFDKMRQNQLELLIQEQRRKDQKRNIIVAILKKTATRRALLVGCLLQAIQQLAGINTVMYYTATIIEMSGVQSQSIAVWLAVPTVAVCVIFSFCGYFLADRLNRRTLTLGSLMGVIISLLVLGTGFHLTSMNEAIVTSHNMTTLENCYSKRDCASCISDPRCGFCYDAKTLAVALCLEKSPDDPSHSIGGECSESNSGHSSFVYAVHICPSMTQGIGLNTWLVLTGLVTYLACFAPGMGPMPWTINSEIYPNWARSFCYSIATSVNWMFNLLVSLTFISLTEVITTHGAFYLYAVISSIGWLLLFWKLPETRGRSLEDITLLFAKPKQDDQEIIDNNDDKSVNQSNGDGTVFGGGQAGETGNHRQSVGMGHDNLTFAADNMNQPQLQLSAKTAPTTTNTTTTTTTTTTNQRPNSPLVNVNSDNSNIVIGRSTSFKLDNPLSKAANFATSQPDLQLQNQASSTQQQVPQLTTFVPQKQRPKQQHQTKRKYSDDGGTH